jgi:hypothetical protein
MGPSFRLWQWTDCRRRDGGVAFTAIFRVGDAFAQAVHEYAERNSFSGEMLDLLMHIVTALEAEYARRRRPDSYEVRLAGAEAEYESMTVLFDQPPEDEKET